MGEFADKTRKRATEVLRARYSEEPTQEMGPILELIGSLLEDGAGGVLTPTEVPVSTEEWLTWNELILDQEEEVIQAVANILDRELMELPREEEAMRNWAAWLLLAVLDQMAMQ